MITGFNTDVKHSSKVYHVQTEDKGRNNPKIESLVYQGGEILDSYRTSYEESKETMTEDKILELMENQHKRIIRSIKMGKYDDVRQMPEELTYSRGLDDVITEYLEQEKSADVLQLSVSGDLNFKPNEKARLEVAANKLQSNEPVEGAHIRVKMVSTVQKPNLLAKGVTDATGKFATEIETPEYAGGESAIIIQASSDFGVAEQKYPLR